MNPPSNGVRLAIDVGTARIGVARCDRDQIMAMPVTTLKVSDADSIKSAITQIIEFVSEFDCSAIYVGKPISLKEHETASTQMALDFAKLICDSVQIPVRMLDERLSTVSAAMQLRASGKSSRDSKSVIDQVAAVILLDHALAIEKATGTLAGEPFQSEGN